MVIEAMRVCVLGLWHLGCVTAACLAQGGHDVVGLDPNADVISRLREGTPPLLEPGLEQLIATGLGAGSLRFETDAAIAVCGVEVLWVTFDTPVDDDDRPHISTIVDRVVEIAAKLPPHCLVLISSQLPVASTRHIAARVGREDVTFAYSPENLRLGKAIEVFNRPDRVVVGLQSEKDRERIGALLAPFTGNIVWMGLESAEMTKHAINAFLAASVVFMNEIATICEKFGADAKEVERGLKSEARIGPGAYLSPGGAFAGGTLARDVTTLADLGRDLAVPMKLVSAIRDSNTDHRSWVMRKLGERFGTPAGRRVALLGLTYKPATSTLRRSTAIELADTLCTSGATVIAFDPAVPELPAELGGQFGITHSASAALAGADAVVLATPWPEFRDLDWPALMASMKEAVVIDPNWFLASQLRDRPGVTYAAVGLPWSAG
jgi:UDPglucose 6-dehydrogenase